MEYVFSVENPMGAVRTTQRQKLVDPRAKRYEAYKRRVRLVANLAGVPDEIGKDERAVVEIEVCWEKLPKCDLDNAVKGLLDALWKQDRRVKEIHAIALEDCETDIADVTVTINGR